ncbi:hypothetical protein FACS189491_03670 [Spirochaetia bacterium]|nr:hypothetical protein FACS189491_03670 [Spirochaetia bacterium]
MTPSGITYNRRPLKKPAGPVKTLCLTGKGQFAAANCERFTDRQPPRIYKRFGSGNADRQSIYAG